MSGAVGAGQSASGDRSVAAHTISGTVATGDNTWIVTLEPGAIPAPGQVAIVTQVDYLPRPPATFRQAAASGFGRPALMPIAAARARSAHRGGPQPGVLQASALLRGQVGPDG